ncbi:MAG TPA: isoprenylcysteine carboxylmethyltransferase family protein [Candidatus Gallacutalibacter stercoravium]|nr:isoprenylcysteine carboxylmethyltransferase family protein [Candidatus Gallacutalibacter stercoravium]
MTVRGVWLLVPFLFIRFGLLAVINREAVKRAAYFAPMKPNERWIYWLYQLSTAALLVSLCFLKILVSFSWLFYISVVLYFIGLALCAAAVVNFAAPSQEGLHTNGVYRYSRNPMYVSYFLIFTACALLTQSLALGGMVIVFIFASHGIILAEERWCMEEFAGAYLRYMQRVRRYI